MNMIECEAGVAFGQAASKWCEQNISRSAAKSIYIPAGQTPIALYREWEAKKPGYLDGLRLLQIDDVLTGTKQGLFKQFFRDQLPSFQNQIKFIERADEQADLAILGLGLNGHIAFHEPELPEQFFSGCVKLSSKTLETLSLEQETWGLTYGASAFAATKSILMMVSGTSKREILQRLLKADPQLPAAKLLKHPGFTILADRDARS